MVKEYRWRTRGNVLGWTYVPSPLAGFKRERTAFPAASLHRSPLVGRATTVTSTTSLMLRTIALAGVHDGKSISFRVSLSGSWHETKFRATRKGREKGEEGILCLRRTNYSWTGGGRCSCSIRGHKKNGRKDEDGGEGRKRRILGGESIHLAASLGT